jgi:ribosomal protein S18 acetylase RimI-like enzyme
VGIEFRKLTEHDPARGEALDVMRAAFAGMQGRIDPPSSLGDLTVERLSQTASEAEVWVATTKAKATEFGLIVGTVILTPKDKVLCVGKLAVSDRRTGFGRALMAMAEDRAQALGFGWLELESRVELFEVHAVFKALGFREIGRTTHAGYVRATSILFRKRVG